MAQTNNQTKKVILIDGTSYVFRAYYAIQRLSTSKGVPTNAVYGFVNMLTKVLETEKPEYLAIAFDTAAPTFREEKYADYKSNREAPPEDLITQIPVIQRAVDCFDIHRVEKPGFEADDVLATLALQAEENGFLVEVITGDKDLMQLVTEKTTLFDTMKDKRYDAKAVEEKFGVRPDQIADLLALMGDSSDNIPGVTGVGEKTAADLIREFGSVEGIYESLDKIKQEKRRETLRKEKENAFLSKELATVYRQVPLKFTWDELKYEGPNQDLLRGLFMELEFQNLIKRFNLDAPAAKVDRSGYQVIRTPQALKDYLASIEKKPMLAVDTETTSLQIHSAECVGISLCAEAGRGVYIPFGHHGPGDSTNLLVGQMSVAEARSILKPILENEMLPKVGQNLKYDIQILRRWGIELQGVASDTLIESYLIDPDQPHNLDSLAFRFMGHQNITYEELVGSGKQQIPFSEVPIEKAAEYSAEDADVTLKLHEIMYPKLKEEGSLSLYEKIELPLVSVLADMEYVGAKVDGSALEKMSVELLGETQALESRIHKIAGEEFNINSPKQLSKILFEKLKLPIIKKTKTGISTDESVLTQLAGNHEICLWIVQYREYGKLRSTFVDGLLSQIHPKTKRVHTNYNQAVTATGRLSSSNPNLQNIPSSDGRFDVRSVFIAEPGNEILSADYSQVELRLLADMSEDPVLIKAFAEDEDVHAYTGKLIFGVQNVTDHQRRVAKTINFGVIYGQTPYGLSQMLKISPKEAKDFIDAYFARYSKVRKFMDQLVSSARYKGYALTKLGRRRYIAELGSENRMRREMAERAAINTPLQGSAADMIKKAMVTLYRRLKDEKLKSQMVLQVHDELVLEVPVSEKARAEQLVREEMESAMDLKVPLKVDLGWGKNWSEAG